MGSQEYLNPDLRTVLETYRTIRKDYEEMKARIETKTEELTAAEEEATKLKESLGKATKAYLALEKRHTSTVEELRQENSRLQDSLSQLQEQFDHLRVVNVDRNIEEQQIRKLEEEVEVLKAQLALQEEKHREDIAALKRKHFDEIKDYKTRIDNADSNTVTKACGKKGNRGRGGGKRGGRKHPTCFRWPKLDIVNKKPLAEKETVEEEVTTVPKKRKLFFEDREEVTDIVQL